MTTWTPRALASSGRPYAHTLWRVVEAQHTASTMRLVESLADQSVLESILDESKPAVPPAAARLHYLLATPFRYRPRVGSRFREAFAPGVWYGAEELRTAMAEKSYWRLRFLLDSPATPDLGPVPHTAFTAAVGAAAIDLTVPPLVRDRARWTHRSDYAPTQALAAAARDADLAAIRYESVRDPERAACVAVLTPAAFRRTTPLAQQTWFVAAGRERVRCARSRQGATGWEFTRAQLVGT